MPDKPHACNNALSALPGHRIVELSGTGAGAFAQAQFMNNVDPLAPGQWQWSGWLTPKGRVVALFALLRLDPQTLWLLLPDADPLEFAGALRRFVFRSKVCIAVRDDLQVLGALSAPRQARGNVLGGNADAGVELDLGGDGGPRCLHILAADVQDRSEADPDFAARWAAADLAHGLPRLPAGQAAKWTPQQLSLERLQAFSVKKGCYPGQEIVARTHFLGKAKRGLALLETHAAAEPGDALASADTTVGELVSVTTAGDARLALAVVSLEAGNQQYAVRGEAAPPRPLMDGLAR